MSTYRRVAFRLRDIEGDFETRMAAGWDILCSKCGDTVLGRLFMPFSGGYILHGSVSHLDPRLVVRDGPEQQTGEELRRFGPPTNLYGRRKGLRTLRMSGTELSVNGAFWVYCFVCNTGQAMEPDQVFKHPDTVIESPASPRSERPRQER